MFSYRDFFEPLTSNMPRKFLLFGLVPLFVAFVAFVMIEEADNSVDYLQAQPQSNDWSVHSSDVNGSRYSELSQITPENVHGLEVAWTYRSGEMNKLGEVFKQTKDSNIPLKIRDSLIICTPSNRVISVNPATGKEQWEYDPKVNLNISPHERLACRGVAYWKDQDAKGGSECAERILFNTTDRRLIALDFESGRLCSGFGDTGVVRIAEDKPLRTTTEITFFMPPAIVNGVAVIGSAITDNLRVDAPSGKVRAFDARSGKPLWEWDPIPRDSSDPAYATWHNDSAKLHGAANVWGFMTVDAERDLLYLPVSSPALDMWGVTRPGENLYSESVVALKGATGKIAWHFQIVHHDIWDYDTAPQPLLADIPLNGETVPALIQNTKQGMIFVLNRETGKPIFPVEERPVPKGDIPGEWYSPTQPFPTTPEPLRPLTLSPDDAWGVTPWAKSACKRKIESLRHGPMYIPPSEQGTIVPWWVGGAEWPGPAYDPENNVMVINTNQIFGVYTLIPKEKLGGNTKGLGINGATPMDGTPYAIDKQQFVGSDGVPCTKPPWGMLTAVDMKTGKHLWQVPFGSIEKFAPFKPKINMDWWGAPNLGGPIITKSGLIFIAASFDQRFRAYNLKDGKKLWEVVLPADAQTTPITYSSGGRQFVVIVAGGNGQLFNARGDYVVAYALPEKR